MIPSAIKSDFYYILGGRDGLRCVRLQQAGRDVPAQDAVDVEGRDHARLQIGVPTHPAAARNGKVSANVSRYVKLRISSWQTRIVTIVMYLWLCFNAIAHRNPYIVSVVVHTMCTVFVYRFGVNMYLKYMYVNVFFLYLRQL